jgi:acetyl-CoA carboxylase biotin carboxyl carrier protein
MNQKELKELIDFLIEKDISEFELERGDVKVRIKRGADSAAPVIAHTMPIASMPLPVPVAASAPAAAAPSAPAATPPAAAPPAAAEEDLHQVKSPIVGTFYEAPAPGAPPFVKPGDQVAAGQVLCIIEAMKLMNEIEADVSGEIVKALVNNGQAVEYGQPLFAVRPRK